MAAGSNRRDFRREFSGSPLRNKWDKCGVQRVMNNSRMLHVADFERFVPERVITFTTA